MIRVAKPEFEGTLLVISHDREFLDRVTTRILWMEDGRGSAPQLLPQSLDTGTLHVRVSFPDARGFVLKEFVRGMNNNRRAVMSRQIATALFSGFTMRG